MRWTQSTPSSAIWTTDQLAYHLRLDADLSSIAGEQAYLLELQAEAVEYAETVMGCSLISRTVTAVYYDSDPLYLPHGPIVSITSVTDARGSISGATVQGFGNADLLVLPAGFKGPLTVVYVAGWGASASSVPADIRGAIRAHVGTLYERRESAGDRTLTVTPHSLEDFYRLKSRNCPVG